MEKKRRLKQFRRKAEKNMKAYKGHYVDNIIFHTEAEIDEFIKQQDIKAYQMAVEIFAFCHTMEASIFCAEKAETLVKKHGFTWDQVEKIEIDILKSAS